jgi:hypothetical protein
MKRTNTLLRNDMTTKVKRHARESAISKARLASRTLATLALAAMTSVAANEADARGNSGAELAPPIVFQAAGPTAQSIQSTVDAFRAALGDPNNANAPGPLSIGRREINWDGGGANATTSAPVTPFDVFLNTRGAEFTTPGTGLTQAPPAGGPDGGLAGLFNNPTYGTIFSAFSPLRLFSPVDSNVTEGLFFVPGSSGGTPALVNAFGAVFTDVDQQGGRQGKGHDTQLNVFDADGNLLFSGSVPASPGDASLSFLGVVFPDARIAKVRIRTGSVPPGPNDDLRHDIVMMDDFIYGEPQLGN